jgi:hypothetical protein
VNKSLESCMIACNQHSEVSTTGSLTDYQIIMDKIFRKADHVRTADLEAQLNSKKEEIVKLPHMLGTTEQEDLSDICQQQIEISFTSYKRFHSQPAQCYY